MIEFVLWGRKPDEEDWKEELITSTSDKEHLKKAEEWAKEQGFITRISKLNLSEKPDFVRTIKN